jgi:nuclear cap-binding protein subunit 1
MKSSCIERLSSWFAYHLSNFQYRWSWEEWKDCAEEDIESPRNKFLKDTMIRCMRLSYHQRVVDFVPETMNQLIPKNPKPTYKYITEEASELEGVAVANKLLELFKNRAIPEEIFQILRGIPDTFNEKGIYCKLL